MQQLRLARQHAVERCQRGLALLLQPVLLLWKGRELWFLWVEHFEHFVGALLVFLWFNIPPARFFLSETGTMGLTTTLTVIAFLTGHALLLPIIAFPLVLTTLSVIIQLISKKFRNGKKVFLVAPLHNHFIAKGWPPHKVTMRYWTFSVICAVVGIVLAIVV